MPRLLLVDDEEKFRTTLVKRLEMRGYDVIGVPNGEEAIREIRAKSDIDVVILDRKMPGMSGEQALQEMKGFRPELQVIMLTGHGSLESAMATGRHDAYAYLQKPYELDELIKCVDAAREHKILAAARHEVPLVEKGSAWNWLKGSHNSRPGIIILGLLLFAIISLAPAPDRLLELLSAPKTGEISDVNIGYASYPKMAVGETVAHNYSKSYKITETAIGEDGAEKKVPMSPGGVATKAQVMLAVLVVAALFWATGAVPIGITALSVGVIMYFTGVLHPDDIAQAYAKDAVIFIFGVLAMSTAISKTGLDRRIGLLLLGPAKSLKGLLFIFLPMLGITCSFISEHALIAFIMPLFMVVYVSAIRSSGIRKDKALVTMFVLAACFTANCGGPGSPAAGGRNAVMLGILADYGTPPTFGEWVMYGLPFVPVMALVIGAYFYFALRKKVELKDIDVSHHVRVAAEKIGPMNRREYTTAVVLAGVVLLWIFASDSLGMGGPVILGIVALNIFRVLRWRDVATIPWDVVALYASAAAMGKGLAVTGGALFMADGFVSILPEFMRSGEGLAMAASIFTGVVTNFMSDGAAVSAIGPITVPMATITGTSQWMVGFATAFASSFAHMLIIGTPNNAIAYTLARDPNTGEQLVSLGDFLKHGAAILLLSFLVLWVWVFFGYWRWIGF
jgi:sodium-dependent dicarboxylate transporter 2/3/5